MTNIVSNESKQNHKTHKNKVVYKNRLLASLWRSDWPLLTFKLLDVYLAKIDNKNPETREITFSKIDFESLLGVKRLSTGKIQKALDYLSSPVPIETKDKKIIQIELFEMAKVFKEKDGLVKINLVSSKKADTYFFNIAETGFFRYKLGEIANLKSRYSYLAFIALETRRFRRSFEFDFDEFKKVIGCTIGIYSEYARFLKKIFIHVSKELTQKTDLANCEFKYEPLRYGRCVKSILFTLEPRKKVKKAKKAIDPVELARKREEDRHKRDLEIIEREKQKQEKKKATLSTKPEEKEFDEKTKFAIAHCIIGKMILKKHLGPNDVPKLVPVLITLPSDTLSKLSEQTETSSYVIKQIFEDIKKDPTPDNVRKKLKESSFIV